MDAWFLYSKEAMHPNFFILFFLFPTFLFPTLLFLLFCSTLFSKTIDINFDQCYYQVSLP